MSHISECVGVCVCQGPDCWITMHGFTTKSHHQVSGKVGLPRYQQSLVLASVFPPPPSLPPLYTFQFRVLKTLHAFSRNSGHLKRVLDGCEWNVCVIGKQPSVHTLIDQMLSEHVAFISSHWLIIGITIQVLSHTTPSFSLSPSNCDSHSYQSLTQ